MGCHALLEGISQTQGLNAGILHSKWILYPLSHQRSKEFALQCRRCAFSPWVGKIPWRRKWLLIPVFLPGKSYGQRSLEGYSLWGPKMLDMTQQLNNSVIFYISLTCFFFFFNHLLSPKRISAFDIFPHYNLNRSVYFCKWWNSAENDWELLSSLQILCNITKLVHLGWAVMIKIMSKLG